MIIGWLEPLAFIDQDSFRCFTIIYADLVSEIGSVVWVKYLMDCWYYLQFDARFMNFLSIGINLTMPWNFCLDSIF